MSDKGQFARRQRDYIRRLGNPYAGGQLHFTDANHGAEPYVRHPYAFAAKELDEMPAASKAAPKVRKARLSVADYRKQCGRIFSQYVEEVRGRKLPDRFREFIDRNESRSPSGRAAIVRGLSKYDLGDLRVAGQFHRAPADLTDGKLAEIEQEAAVDE